MELAERVAEVLKKDVEHIKTHMTLNKIIEELLVVIEQGKTSKMDKLTVEQYRQWKEEGIPDRKIMLMMGYNSGSYTNPLQDWKKKNNIPGGRGMAIPVDLKVRDVKVLRDSGMSYWQVANHFDIEYEKFYYWIKKLRKAGIFL